MKRLTLTIILGLLLLFAVSIFAFVAWMGAGDEAPLDYSMLDYELGPQDAELNGYTHLREFCQVDFAEIPENYPFEFEENGSDEINYNRFENWDLEFFKSIVQENREYMLEVEAAFNREQFLVDQRLTYDSMVPELSGIREYLTLRILEARILLLSGQPGRAFERLQDLANEVERFTHSGAGGLIGFLTSVALNGIVTNEISVFQERGQFSVEQLLSFARDLETARFLPTANAMAMKQEFYSIRDVLDRMTDERVNELIADVEYIEHTIFGQKMALTFGLRKNRTINEFYRGYVEYGEQAVLPRNQRKYPHNEAMLERLENSGWRVFLSRNPIGNILYQILYPAILQVSHVADLAVARLSAARLSLALQAYYQNEGALPDSLEALVPDYLPAIPLDPYDHEPMRYSKTRGIIYSVGDDFVDNGGSDKAFLNKMSVDDERDSAELDRSEPTFPLMFLPMHRTKAAE